MALSQPKGIFGFHSISPYNRTTKEFYGIAQVVQNGTVSLEGGIVELRGGSNVFTWAAERGDINANMAFSISEYPDWLFTLFGGKAPTVGSAEASGFASSVSNAVGTTVASGTTGVVTTIAVTAADLKFGKYVIKATAADALKVYVSTNVDFSRGTQGDYTDDLLEIAEFTSIGNAASLEIASFGLEFTSGSAVALTEGDTATFTVRPINTENRTVKIGGISDTFPEFGFYAYNEKQSTGLIQEIHGLKAKTGGGLTLGAARKEWGSQEYSATLLYDSVSDGILEYSDVVA